MLIVLYVGTQLAASLVTALSADPTQRRIMLALPFVFAIFIVNFPAGLILYWITTNVWTIGQQLLVKKLYPKPEPREPSDDDGDGKAPARGKPPAQKAAEDEDGKAPAAGARPGSPAATAPRASPRPTRARRRSAQAAGAEGGETRMSSIEEPMDLVAEASGASLGEAKWSAMKELEPRFPGVTAECVSFEVRRGGRRRRARPRARGGGPRRLA